MQASIARGLLQAVAAGYIGVQPTFGWLGSSPGSPTRRVVGDPRVIPPGGRDRSGSLSSGSVGGAAKVACDVVEFDIRGLGEAIAEVSTVRYCGLWRRRFRSFQGPADESGEAALPVAPFCSIGLKNPSP